MAHNLSSPKPLILVVDDEALLRLLATDVLEDDGYRVLEAGDADTALKLLTEHGDVGVVFTDVNMPGALDGLDLAHEVHRRWPKVKLIVTSGRVHPKLDDIPDAGRFVPKPYSPEDLLQEVKTAVGPA